jgi:bifunctional non-homologous end joining protein LigD
VGPEEAQAVLGPLIMLNGNRRAQAARALAQLLDRQQHLPAGELLLKHTMGASLLGGNSELVTCAYVKTTGSRGLHVVAPLDRSVDFDDARAFARELAALLAERKPKRYTVEQRRGKRRGRLYIDTARNAYAQTAVAAYAVRALPGAPVACPLAWQELGRVEPRQFTVRNIGRRLAGKNDPCAKMDGDARSLHEPQRRLAQLRSNA